MIGNSRVKKMSSRDALLQELLAAATEDITSVSKGEQYPTLLKALIVQSMIKIEEDKITVICRDVDVAAVNSVVDVSGVGAVLLHAGVRIRVWFLCVVSSGGPLRCLFLDIWDTVYHYCAVATKLFVYSACTLGFRKRICIDT